MKSRRETVVYQNCVECHRLWQELSAAAKAYVRIYESIKGIAAKRRDGIDFAKTQLRKAAEGRRIARKAVKYHEAERHWTPPRRRRRFVVTPAVP